MTQSNYIHCYSDLELPLVVFSFSMQHLWNLVKILIFVSIQVHLLKNIIIIPNLILVINWLIDWLITF